MMNTIKGKSWMVGLALLSAVGCKKDKAPVDLGGVGDKYFVAAIAGDATYTLAVDDLEKDTVYTTQHPGTIENAQASFTQFGYNGTNAIVAINYRQGNPAPGYIFQLNAKGQLRLRDEFILDAGFNSIGSFGNYLGAIANGETLTGANDGKKGSVVYLIDLQNDNRLIEQAIVTENFVGNGQTGSFVGIADAGNGTFFTAVNLAAVTGGSAVNPDSIYVAKMDANLNLLTLYKDDRINASGGQMRSARYGQIANDSEGNTYVFSTGYGATTTKKAGALRINKGAATFDASYHFDIEAKSEGYKFRKVWNITGDYFLLEMYNAPGLSGAGSQSPANQFAVVRMSTQDFKWVREGFPDVSTITGSGWPFTANGKAYVSIVTPDTQPTVYAIDPVTATAKKGISVFGATSIPGLAKLSPQSHIQD